ncbi:hypothetical protein ES319_D01G198500v1 [Gossypium barbadense]|uniref:Uncharacterized protein n=3 Tax=Gossypium TaxID=3633 RepID=A0A5J5SWB2_GOSBA|nr:hypothetical protein ES319_D01G198500v1 [Gossypium barbadense]TYG83985.1 hypothetical protein ES288_D01G213300v1 [Gossypium darwinii]TYH88818.1 hypothetical protein ES332_D01G215200v1 [Gossypium tomentosum]
MASSTLNQKSNFHARSSSLPSRPHPLVTQIDEHLCRLKANESASSSSSSMSQKLSGLSNLYELVDNLLQLPLTQKSLAQQCNDKQVNELLNGSLKLLGAKEDTQQLPSILRRRRGDEAGFTYEAKEYFASRKKAKKLRNKSQEACKCGFALLENDAEAAFSMLGEVQRVAFTVSKRVTHEGEATETNEIEKMDAVLCTLIGNKTRKSGKMSHDDAQIELQKLESSIQDLGDGVECLVKTRVSVLNILSH